MNGNILEDLLQQLFNQRLQINTEIINTLNTVSVCLKLITVMLFAIMILQAIHVWLDYQRYKPKGNKE